MTIDADIVGAVHGIFATLYASEQKEIHALAATLKGVAETIQAERARAEAAEKRCAELHAELFKEHVAALDRMRERDEARRVARVLAMHFEGCDTMTGRAYPLASIETALAYPGQKPEPREP